MKYCIKNTHKLSTMYEEADVQRVNLCPVEAIIYRNSKE